MVQKRSARGPGRPREYDPELAMTKAMDAFWRNGFAATSLDDLSAATGMNRPSLYHAFGDKRRMYLALLDRYIEEISVAVQEELGAKRPLRQGLTCFYRRMLSTYRTTKGEARGCFLIGTAVTESMGDEEVRAKLAAALSAVTGALRERFKQAQVDGELAAGADVTGLTEIASAVLHSLAIRVRAGEGRAALGRTVDSVVELICGAGQQR